MSASAKAFTASFRASSSWIIDATNGGINQDDLVFTLLVASLFWFLGYNLAWHLFRVDRVWRAILPPALILISNSVYYTGSANLDGYMIVFTFLSLLLVVRSNLDAREWDWYLNGIRVPRRLRKQVFRVGALLALIVLVGAWAVPRNDIEQRLAKFPGVHAVRAAQQLSELWNRLFSSAETQGPTTADYYGGDSLQLGGAIRLGDQTVFLVTAPQGRRYYWRSRVFDNYDNGRWTSAADTRLTDPESPLNVQYEDYPPRRARSGAADLHDGLERLAADLHRAAAAARRSGDAHRSAHTSPTANLVESGYARFGHSPDEGALSRRHLHRDQPR